MVRAHPPPGLGTGICRLGSTIAALRPSVSSDGSTPLGTRTHGARRKELTSKQCSRYVTPQCIDPTSPEQPDGTDGTDGSFQLYTHCLGDNSNLIYCSRSGTCFDYSICPHYTSSCQSHPLYSCPNITGLGIETSHERPPPTKH
jgi:hypothetical protein